MYRLLSILIAVVAMAPAMRADIYTKSSDGIRILNASADSAGMAPRVLTPVEAADTLVIIPERFYDVYEPGYLSP